VPETVTTTATPGEERAPATPGRSDGAQLVISAPLGRVPAWRAARRRPRPPVYRGHQYLPVVAFVLAVAVLVPNLVDANSDRNLVNLWLVYSIAAIGFYWIFGLAGRFAFCQTLAMAFGGYLTAWAAREEWPFWTGLVLASLGAAAGAAVVGYVLRHSTDLAFAIGTVAVLEIGHTLLGRTSEFTGQHGDVTNIPYPTWFGTQLTTEGQVFWLFLGVLAAVLVLGVMIERSPLRRTLVAGRENTLVARTLGQRVVGAQVLFFALGSALGGLSGALIAHWQGVTGVSSFGIDLAIGIFLMVILGGRHSLWGGVIGAAFYIWIPELLSGFDRYRSIIYAVLLLVAIMVFPEGLVGVFHQLRRVARFRFRPRDRTAAPSAGTDT
jgi:branched-chain amino acid transport system permease protein